MFDNRGLMHMCVQVAINIYTYIHICIDIFIYTHAFTCINMLGTTLHVRGWGCLSCQGVGYVETIQFCFHIPQQATLRPG